MHELQRTVKHGAAVSGVIRVAMRSNMHSCFADSVEADEVDHMF